MNALETALHAKLTGDATLMGYLPGGVHNLVARRPRGCTDKQFYPHLVYQKVSGNPSAYTFTQIVSEPYVYQVRIIGKGETSKKNLGLALARVRALLHLQSLTIVGYAHWLTRWEGDMPDMAEVDDDGEELVQVGASYRIEVRAG